MLTKMNPTVKTKFVAALRSGKYRQCSGHLFLDTQGTGKPDKFCALGVLCDIHRKEVGHRPIVGDAYYRHSITLPRNVERWAGLASDAECKIMELNDKKSWSFKQLAAYIERYL